MTTVTSADGTAIAFDRLGQGPGLILITGALNARASASWPSLAQRLSPSFTVYNYDRRGRGQSGDTQPYAVAREVEDIEALIGDAGGSVFLYGHSSGACLALEAALSLRAKVARVALYEAPYNDDPRAQSAWAVYTAQLRAALADGRRGDAVALFLEYIGMPGERVAGMRQAPFWAGLEALAPTLAYDHPGIMGPTAAVPTARLAELEAPALVMCGGRSLPFMCETAHTLGHAIPDAQLRTLPDEDHDVPPEVLAPLLTEFFLSA